jgi:hypothetical protein
MPTCALCENVQATGESCDVCGRPFPAGVGVPAPVERLPDLEATLAEPVEAAAERLADIDPTRLDPVQVVVAAMEGLEPTEAEGIPDDEPSPAAVACRYCRTPAPAGEAFCSHCGMRLPTPVAAAEAEPEPVLCRDCGALVRGAACPACGLPVRLPTPPTLGRLGGPS